MAGILNFGDLGIQRQSISDYALGDVRGQQAVQERLKTLGINALRNIYGDIAGAPQEAKMLQDMQQSKELHPGAMEKQTLGNEQTRQTIQQNAEKHPYEIAQKQVGVTNTQATTANTQERTKTQTLANTAEEEQRQAQAALMGIERAEVAIANGADPAAVFSALGEAGAKAFGIPPEQLAEFGAAIKANPALIGTFKEQLRKMAQGAKDDDTGTLTPEAIAGLAERVAKGDKTALTGLGYGKAGAANRAAVNNAVYKLQNPDVIGGQQLIGAQTKYAKSLAGNGPSDIGGRINAATAVIEHMGLLDEYVTALQNGNVKLANSLRQTYKDQTGQLPPVQFDAQKALVAKELERYFVGGRGTKEERLAFEEMLSRARSPQQLRGVIDAWSKSLGAQMVVHRKQAEAIKMEGEFDKHLTPRAKRMLGVSDAEINRGSAVPAAKAGSDFREGVVYQDKSGNKARFEGGKWVPVQ
jgi:hypothetical protein